MAPVSAAIVRMVEIVSHLHHEHITVVAGLCTAIEIDALQARRKAIRASSETIVQALRLVGGAPLLRRQRLTCRKASGGRGNCER